MTPLIITALIGFGYAAKNLLYSFFHPNHPNGQLAL